MKKLISFLAGIIIFSILPLLGWGIGNLSDFFSSQARTTFIVMMAGLSLLVVVFVPDEGRAHGKGKRNVKKHWISLLILQIIPLFLLLATPFSDRFGFAVFTESEMIRYAGILVTLSGFFLMNWSVIALDRQFSIDITIQENHKLVTNGPYKWVRHPRYSGIVIFLIGISLAFRSWGGIVVAICLLPVFLWRIKDEEKLMHQEFGAEWINYKKQTSCLIPFLF
ncbi:MAG: hypothetical protein CVU14_06295 [Bacteroidetes bacterium HGW-Bacteroidetes-9]|jgi:protein-S-isoprenylcysteine O-methyltransferase Ste14|nr:MAG: hypothetical protein CVU14_06295 [Bacteroidetes bacterium HGW-Bacteroidetes-9]